MAERNLTHTTHGLTSKVIRVSLLLGDAACSESYEFHGLCDLYKRAVSNHEPEERPLPSQRTCSAWTLHSCAQCSETWTGLCASNLWTVPWKLTVDHALSKFQHMARGATGPVDRLAASYDYSPRNVLSTQGGNTPGIAVPLRQVIGIRRPAGSKRILVAGSTTD